MDESYVSHRALPHGIASTRKVVLLAVDGFHGSHPTTDTQCIVNIKLLFFQHNTQLEDIDNARLPHDR